MFSQDKIQKLSQILNQNKSFAIFMHENPDWDTIGSALAVWRILEKLWKKVDYFCPSKPSKKFYYLEEVKKIQTEFDFADYDVLIFVDIWSVSKQLWKIWLKNADYWQSKFKIVFDHHFSAEDWGDLTFRDWNKASTCQVIYEIFKLIYPNIFDKKIADFLFLGHITDTNFCQRTSAWAKEIRLAADLVELWADKNLVIENLFYNSSLNAIKFLWVLIDRIKFEDWIIWTWYVEEELEGFWIDKEDADYIMEIMRKIKDWQIYLLLRKIDWKLKGSIRSKIPIADQIARQFWWGWHKFAAGFKQDLQLSDFKEEVEKVVKMIKKEISEDLPR